MALTVFIAILISSIIGGKSLIDDVYTMIFAFSTWVLGVIELPKVKSDIDNIDKGKKK